jgi:Tol biopolymer transport system component
MFAKPFAALLLLTTVLSASAILLGYALPSAILAFVSDRTGVWQIYLVDIDHSITIPVTRDEANYESPAWSALGDLAFVRAQPFGRDIVVVNPFTGSRCEINGRLLDEYAPAWSAEGQLAYIVALNGHYDIYVQQGCDGRTAHPVATDFRSAYRPRWSGEGRLVFADGTGETPQIFIFDLATGETLPISQRGDVDADPVWVGDSMLAFLRVEADREIYVYDVLSGEPRNISQSPADDRQPAGSSDGRVAFMSNRDGNSEIYVYDVAADSLVNVSRSLADDTLPSWSADGRLTYASAQGAVYDIMVLDQAPDGTPRLVVQHPAQDYNPVWLP